MSVQVLGVVSSECRVSAGGGFVTTQHMHMLAGMRLLCERATALPDWHWKVHKHDAGMTLCQLGIQPRQLLRTIARHAVQGCQTYSILCRKTPHNMRGNVHPSWYHANKRTSRAQQYHHQTIRSYMGLQ